MDLLLFCTALYYLIWFTCDGVMAVRAREKINSLDESDEINIGDEVMVTWIGHDYKAIVIAIIGKFF